MIAVFLWTAQRKRDDALIDLRLFKSKVFSTVAITQFLSNGGMFGGQMLIPAFLIQACRRAPGEMGWMLAPLGIGMMLTLVATPPLLHCCTSPPMASTYSWSYPLFFSGEWV
jgi:predicted MFS family arabinose efflux permease